MKHFNEEIPLWYKKKIVNMNCVCTLVCLFRCLSLLAGMFMVSSMYTVLCLSVVCVYMIYLLVFVSRASLCFWCISCLRVRLYVLVFLFLYFLPMCLFVCFPSCLLAYLLVYKFRLSVCVFKIKARTCNNKNE